jgi:hypothetical protein
LRGTRNETFPDPRHSILAPFITSAIQRSSTLR